METIIAARLAAVIGLVFGALSVVAGGRVLAGIDQPGYVVLRWLVLYNVAAGLVAVVAGAGLWWPRPWAVRLAWTLAGAHGVVLFALITIWGAGGQVAPDSLAAMALRALVWGAIALITARALGTDRPR